MTTLSRTQLLLIVFGALILLVGAFAARGLWARLFGPHVVVNKLVGRSESQIEEEYGPPASDQAEYQQLARRPHGILPPGPFRTVIYDPRGLYHLEGGTLCVWYSLQGKIWVCFESCWFASTVRF